jgi:hypothetical protein
MQYENYSARIINDRVDIWTYCFICSIDDGTINISDDLMTLGNRMGFVFQEILTLSIIAEASNNGWELDLRQKIFDVVCQSRQMVFTQVLHENNAQIEDLIYLANQWMLNFSNDNGLVFDRQRMFSLELPPQPEYRAVNAEAFVSKTFQLLAPNSDNYCGICHSGPDEQNDDETQRVFRSMPFCHQMCCHGCLVHQATVCNTPDHQNELKNTGVFICPFCRNETPFFPDEN